jgi:hypothetical protein
MSNNQWLIKLETAHPYFISDYDNCWDKVLTDTLDDLAAKKDTYKVEGLNGLKRYCRKHFPYVKHEKQYESISEKLSKQFYDNRDMNIFDDYRPYFPILFTKPNPKNKNNQVKQIKQVKEVKKQQVKVTDFTSDNNICFPFNITTTHNSVNFAINDLNSEQTKFMYNHIVEGVNSLASVRARVL